MTAAPCVVDVCPYMAIKIEEFKDNGNAHRRITTDKALCKGCGLCAATCPKGGVVVHGFTMEQLQAQVDEVVAIKAVSDQQSAVG